MLAVLDKQKIERVIERLGNISRGMDSYLFSATIKNDISVSKAELEEIIKVY